MNLAVPDAQEVDLKRSAVLGVALLVLVAAFIKFGVYDFHARVAKASSELAELTAVNNELEAQLTDYDKVLEEYNLYESARMVSDANTVPVLDALQLIDEYITPQAYVSSLVLSDNVLSLNLSGITLDNTGSLVSTLYQQPIVKSVTVASASGKAQSTEDATVTMSITLTPVIPTTDSPEE